VVALNGETIVDFDINEALAMHKDLDQQGLEVLGAMTGVQQNQTKA